MRDLTPAIHTSVPSVVGFSPSEVSRRLLPWYGRAGRDLPWRRRPTPYSVWVSEVMLQQTRVDVVVERYRSFLARFPTLRALARAPVDDVVAAWSGLGYYRRARSLHAGAQTVLERHGGRFPRTLDEALELPGVGRYTAGAVLSIAYNLAVPAVDGNVERVVSRLLAWGDDLRKAMHARSLRRLVESWIPDDPSSFNQALMELGATVCTPRSPRCGECPVQELCAAYRGGDPEAYPAPTRKQKVVPVSLHAAVLRKGQRYLLERVEEGSFLKGMWVFPFAEEKKAVLARLTERLASTCSDVRSLGSVRHAITFRRITLEAHEVRCRGRPAGGASASLRWVEPAEFGKSVAVSSLVFKVLALLERHRSEA